MEEEKRHFLVDVRIGCMEGGQLKGILDTGASHCFVDEKVVQGWEIRKSSFEISLADGRMVHGSGTVSVQIAINGVQCGNWELIVIDLPIDVIIGRNLIVAMGGRIKWPVQVPELGVVAAIDHNITHMPASDKCNVCLVAKIRQHPARRSTSPPTPGVLHFGEEMSVDLIDVGQDPTVWGFDGSRYVFTLLDSGDATRWAECRNLKSKTAAVCANTLSDIQRGAQSWMKRLRADRGSEFDDKFESLLQQHGTKRVYTLAGRSNSNAQHERFHGTFNPMVRANLTQSGLPTPWWPLAADYAAWTYNRFHNWKGKTPFEWRYGRSFDKTRLAIPFGALIVVLNDDAEKFEARGRIQDFKATTTEFPARALGLRNAGETFLFGGVDNLTPTPEQNERCPSCKKPIVRSARCRKCNNSKFAKTHDRGAYCKIGGCRCTEEERNDARRQREEKEQARQLRLDEKNRRIEARQARNEVQRAQAEAPRRATTEEAGAMPAGRNAIRPIAPAVKHEDTRRTSEGDLRKTKTEVTTAVSTGQVGQESARKTRHAPKSVSF